MNGQQIECLNSAHKIIIYVLDLFPRGESVDITCGKKLDILTLLVRKAGDFRTTVKSVSERGQRISFDHLLRPLL